MRRTAGRTVSTLIRHFPNDFAFGLPVYVAASQLAPFNDFHIQPAATAALASGH